MNELTTFLNAYNEFIYDEYGHEPIGRKELYKGNIGVLYTTITDDDIPIEVSYNYPKQTLLVELWGHGAIEDELSANELTNMIAWDGFDEMLSYATELCEKFGDLKYDYDTHSLKEN